MSRKTKNDVSLKAESERDKEGEKTTQSEETHRHESF